MCFAIHLQNSYSSTNHTYLRQSHQIFWYLCDGAMIKHVELKQFMLKLRTMTEKMSATYPASELTFLRVCHIFYKECKKYNRFLNQMKQKKKNCECFEASILYCSDGAWLWCEGAAGCWAFTKYHCAASWTNVPKWKKA